MTRKAAVHHHQPAFGSVLSPPQTFASADPREFTLYGTFTGNLLGEEPYKDVTVPGGEAWDLLGMAISSTKASDLYFLKRPSLERADIAGWSPEPSADDNVIRRRGFYLWTQVAAVAGRTYTYQPTLEVRVREGESLRWTAPSVAVGDTATVRLLVRRLA